MKYSMRAWRQAVFLCGLIWLFVMWSVMLRFRKMWCKLMWYCTSMHLTDVKTIWSPEIDIFRKKSELIPVTLKQLLFKIDAIYYLIYLSHDDWYLLTNICSFFFICQKVFESLNVRPFHQELAYFSNAIN